MKNGIGRCSFLKIHSSSQKGKTHMQKHTHFTDPTSLHRSSGLNFNDVFPSEDDYPWQEKEQGQEQDDDECIEKFDDDDEVSEMQSV